MQPTSEYLDIRRPAPAASADALTRLLHEADLERARREERERLLREMHDGLGSALVSSLVLLEQGRLDMQCVCQVLRECVDDLRLTMDSMEPVEGDLATLLATVRFRLGRRIEAAGIAIHWQVSELPRLRWLDAPAALHVLRVVQEALTNVIKHAHARSVTVQAEVCGPHLRVCVQDDGRGLHCASSGEGGGRGLRNMQRRAEQLGAALCVEQLPGGTRVQLLLPLQRAGAATAGASAPIMLPATREAESLHAAALPAMPAEACKACA